jgi:hypothetical protein
MGVVAMAQYPECDNTFYGLLSHHFYYSVPSNHVYTGKTTVDAQRVESMDDQAHLPDATRCLYKAADWGLPMNLLEVDDLVALIKNPCLAAIDCAEGYLLLSV